MAEDRIATGREPDYREVTRREDSGYAVGITYCTPERYDPQGHRCLEYGGRASYFRCLACPDLEFHCEEFHRSVPKLLWRLKCKPGDYSFNVRRRDCRQCTLRFPCLSERLKDGLPIRLVKIRKKTRN